MNLIQKTRSSQLNWKIILLVALSILLAFLFSYGFKRISAAYLYLIIGSGAGFSVLVILQSIFIKNTHFLLATIFFNTLAILSGFLSHFSYIFLGVFVLIFCFLIWGSFLVKKEQELLTKLNYFRISSRVLPKILTAIALLGTFILYLYFKGQITPTGFVSPERLFEKSVVPAGKIINKFYPGFDFSLTGNELLKMIAMRELEQNPNQKGLPEEIRERVLQQTILEFKKQLKGTVGAEISESLYEKSLSDAIYSILSSKIVHLPENYRTSGTIVLMIIGFLIIRSLIVPFGWLSNVLGFLVFKLLLASGFAEIVTEDVKREIVMLT